MTYPQYPQQQQQQPYSAATGGEPPLWAPYYGAPIAAAVKRFFKKYATFSGRASRSEYWWWTLVSVSVSIVLSLIMSVMGMPDSDGQRPEFGAGAAVAVSLFGLWFLALIVPSIALTVRRLHDSNKSGWWYFISAVPIVGGIILLIFVLLPPDPAGRQYDQPTS
ncbi:DUF805 domain-containing protein [Arthrobacter sp. B1I2]|uniref:DUF805 domain-containing protein n=1 Tax=Arthrobacter sp. B1I2 TaxID=3042263 RepID=UPI0027BADA61|nr:MULTISPECIES: DUF805 domain-containing protein [Arthrobacter]